ncbi:N-acetylmuramoyl-L-alanine amidase [Solitalea sp. MAHUQ-68]|uniref:N-acetylmuramoyl-L-alanine amidase n=1 Tax=Solitalea agri TaxID=2953739 RepID=A0A9X2F1A2_9SPHI|nr:N-acetylmuramoyl-L-alanine amidase [Solitalea agri]MCO4292812.1 N-acetylmuramoyl-L-alanine amidase [Solitalea agri]
MKFDHYKYLFLLTTLLLIASCSDKYAESKKAYKQQLKALIKTLKQTEPFASDSIPSSEWISTVNFNLRKPNYVIIHHTAQDSLAQTIKTFTLTKTQVSAHYVVSKDGKVVHMLNDYLRAWHAGNARWGACTDINSTSIGIELDNNGKEPFSEAQINSLLILLEKLKKTYNIPAANFIGHADIAPVRKPDPSELFPWKKLADKGYGLWYSLPLDTVPTGFNIKQALHIIGYDTRDSNAAVIAFKRHFIQTDIGPVVTDSTKMILNNLYKKY